jgi:hypothetical protein
MSLCFHIVKTHFYQKKLITLTTQIWSDEVGLEVAWMVVLFYHRLSIVQPGDVLVKRLIRISSIKKS